MKGKIIVQEKNKVPFVYQSNDNNSFSDSFKFKANDGEFDSNEGVVNITITQLNDAPTALALSSTSISENSTIGTAVGTLSNTDPDSGNITYSLVSGSGDTDNASFTVDGTSLKTAVSLDYETKNSYSIRLNVNDGNDFYAKSFTITVTDVNESPTDLALSSTSIAENSATGTEVGTLSAGPRFG